MKTLSQMAVFLLATVFCYGQTAFIFSGTIAYERKINIHRQVDPEENQSEWFKEYISRQPRFHLSDFQLFFTKEKSLYQPGKVADTGAEAWFIGPAKENTVLTDLSAMTQTSRKKVFEQYFVVSDSLNRVKWKLSSETRTIAGFECRKAVGIICDSVYVVAFYSEEIPVSSGPESFGGLPGMILGLAVPRLYTTWFATRVEVQEPSLSIFTLNNKGKKISGPALAPQLNSTFNNWGKEGQRFIWWSLL